METSTYREKKFCVIFLSVLSSWCQQKSLAFQPIPASLVNLKIQQNGFQTITIKRRALTVKCTHDKDDVNSSPELDRRSMIKTVTSALLFTFPFTRGQEVSNAAPGLVQFPCNHRLMNTYHFMRSGQSLLESEDYISTNPLLLTNREDALSPLGIEQVQDACNDMMSRDINPSVVKYSLAAKSIDSSNVFASEMKIGRNRLVPEYTFMDPRGIGRWNMQRLSATEEAVWAMDHIRAGKDGRGGLPPDHDDGTPNETLSDQVTRLRELLSVLETHCSGDTILLIFPDGTGPALLSALIAGIPLNRVHELNFEPGEIRYNITSDRVLQDMPNGPLPSYTAAISRGTNTLDKYEADPNQFLDLREEERLAEEEILRKQLAKKEMDIREKKILAQEQELHRKVANEEAVLREKEILAQEKIRRKLAKEQIDLQKKKAFAREEKIQKVLVKKEVLVKSAGNKNTPDKSNILKDKKWEAGKNASTNNVILNVKNKSNPAFGCSTDSSTMALTLAGALAAFKLATNNIEEEKDNYADYDPHSEQTHAKPDIIEANDGQDSHTKESTNATTIGSRDVPKANGNDMINNLDKIKERHDLSTSMLSDGLQNLESTITDIAVSYDNIELNVHKEEKQSLDSRTYLEQISNHLTAAYDNIELNVHKEEEQSLDSKTYLEQISNHLTAAYDNIELNVHKEEEQSLDSKTYLEQISNHLNVIEANSYKSTTKLSKSKKTLRATGSTVNPSDMPEVNMSRGEVDSVESDVHSSLDEQVNNEQITIDSRVDKAKAKNSTFVISPELERMESLVVSAPFDVPELTTNISETEVSASEEGERIDNANAAMEEYLSQDDGGADWLNQMSELMDS